MDDSQNQDGAGKIGLGPNASDALTGTDDSSATFVLPAPAPEVPTPGTPTLDLNPAVTIVVGPVTEATADKTLVMPPDSQVDRTLILEVDQMLGGGPLAGTPTLDLNPAATTVWEPTAEATADKTLVMSPESHVDRTLILEADQTSNGGPPTGATNLDLNPAATMLCESSAEATADKTFVMPAESRNERTRIGEVDQTLSAGAPAAADFSNVTIKGYRILGELGRGGMGVVYKARQAGLNRTVALKMIIAGGHAAPEQLARFRAEAEAVAQLQHPNIVQVYDIGEQDGLPYFSLEFVEGKPLDKELGGKPQSEQYAAQMIETLARAMHYAHEHSIIHRDLKPANVLLTKTGTPKISDFGLAKQLENDSSQTKTGTIMGTPSYMAPEQGRGEKQIGHLADVYALGSMLYEMLTGRPPFLAPTALKTLMRLLNEEPVPPSHVQPGVSRDIETICVKCLQKDPLRRYESAAALADDLRRFKMGEAILARRVSCAERAWRWCKRNPRVAVLYSLVGMLIIAVGISLSVLKVRADRERLAQAEHEKRELEARAEVNRQVAETRKQGQQRLEQASEAISSGNFRKAQDLLLWSDPILSSAAELGDMRRQLAELDGQIKTYAEFRKLFDNARYLGLFGGPALLAKARESSHELIKLYDQIEHREGGGAFGWPPLNIRQHELLKEDIFEALLVASKIEVEAATPAPGDDSDAAAVTVKAAARQSIEWLDRAEKILPPTKALFVWRSGFYTYLGDKEASVADAERAQKIEPTSAVDRFWHAFADYMRAEEFLNLKKDGAAAGNSYRLATTGYAKVVEARPENFWAYFNWANCLTKLGDRYGAVVGYTTCIRLNPDAPWTYSNRGLVHLQLREFELAIADIETAIRLNPDDATGYLRRAEYYQALKELPKAYEDFTRVITLQPNDPVGYLRRGEYFYALKDFGKAQDDFSAGIKLQPNNVQAYRNRAAAALLGKNLDGSLADWQELSKLIPASHEPHFYTAVIRLGRQDLDGALAELDAAIKLKPTDGQSHITRALLYRWQGKFEAALADLNLVLTKLVPNRHDYIVERADLFRALGKFDEALEDYQKCLVIQPKQIDGYLGMASVYDQMGKQAQARDCYERMVKADSTSSTAFLRRAEYLLNRGEFDAAAADCDQAASLDSQSVLPDLVRAQIKAARGDFLTAVTDAAAVLEKAPANDGKILYAAACVYSLAAKSAATATNDPESAKQVQEYSEKAARLLADVVGPCFHDLEYPDHNRMAWDPALAAIRNLPQVEKLLAGRK